MFCVNKTKYSTPVKPTTNVFMLLIKEPTVQSEDAGWSALIFLVHSIYTLQILIFKLLPFE